MKFSIRDLMWLTVIVGLVLGWWLDHRHQNVAAKVAQKSERDAAEKLERLLHVLEMRGEKVSFRTFSVDIRDENAPTLKALTPNSSAPAPDQPNP